MKNIIIDLTKNFSELFDPIDDLVLLVSQDLSIRKVNKNGKRILKVNEGEKLETTLDINQSEKIASLKSNPKLSFHFYSLELNDGNSLFIIKQILKQPENFNQIIDNLPIGVVVFSKNGKIVFYNKSFIDLWGVSKDDLEDYNIFLDERLRSTGLIDKIQLVFEGTPFLFLEGYYDNLLEKGKGYSIWVESTLFPIFNEHNQVDFVVIAHKDISEVKLAQEEIRIAKSEAEESNRLKNTFLQNLSHEIRTPMNAIIGFGNIIFDLVKDKLERNDYDLLANFNIGIKRLNKTLTQILELSQVETGNYHLKIEPVNLKDEILKVVNEIKPEIEQKKLDIILNLNESNQIVLADIPVLNRIFSNLIENAVKFTHKGYIKIETYPNYNETILFCSIKDTGVGISEDYLDHIFEPFSQEDEGYNRSYEGSGLGLALTKRYLDLINSSITVDSVKGVGSTFTFTLPLYKK